MAKIIKRLCLPVGSYQKEGEDKPQIEYRDIGVMLEFEAKDGNSGARSSSMRTSSTPASSSSPRA